MNQHNRQDKRQVFSRQEFLDHLRRSINENKGFATGKIGISERFILQFGVSKAQLPPDSPLLRMMAPTAEFYHRNQLALFPPEPQFYDRFYQVYRASIRELDVLGIFPSAWQESLQLISSCGFNLPVMDYHNQEPDRSTPSQEDNCYLPFLRGKKLLIICSFANLLVERANQATFEGVWSKTGKRWFFPQRVEGLEFPYGYSTATHRQYKDALVLLDEIVAEIGRRDFDMALIAAAGLGIPLAAQVKKMGKAAISLGGHLQILFGISGKRWKNQQEWQERYFNEWWIDMPARYKPPEEGIADGGAYW